MQERVAPRLQRVMSVSAASASDISASMGLRRDSIHIIPNGIDTQAFRRPDGVTPVPGRIFSVASADVPQKGAGYLLRALAMLRDEYPDMHAVLLCRPGRDSQLPVQLQQLGLRDCVRLVHGLTPQQMVHHYASAQVVVVPSLYEGFGLPAVEAMACGAALLTTSGGALLEVAGDAAEVVAPGDAQQLAQGLRRLLDSPQRLADLRRRGRERIERLYSLERMGAAYEQWYLSQLEAVQGTGQGAKRGAAQQDAQEQEGAVL